MNAKSARSVRFDTGDPIALHALIWEPTNAGASEDDAPLVLLHGGGANAHWWDHLAAPLSSTRRVIALDFRGHGDSDYPQERAVSAFSRDLEALVDWLGREDLWLVGHSLGAAVALDHASRSPSLRGAVLIDLARGGQKGSGRRARLALALRRTYRTHEEAARRFRFLPESSVADEALRAHIAEHSVRREEDGRHGYKFDPAWFALPPSPRPDPADVECPILLVRGGDSALLGVDAARAFVAALPDGQLVEIPEAGHHVLLDQPERLLAAIEAFIRDADDRRLARAGPSTHPSP